MKKMTCRQLGGGCDLEFGANTFEEIAEMSKNHGKEMFEKGDLEHMKAMEVMRIKMNDPQMMREWYADLKKQFESLPEEN